MSYTRMLESGHYIWPSDIDVDFDGIKVPNEALDIFLFKLFNFRKTEFMERIENGKEKILNNLEYRLLNDKLSEEDEKEIRDRIKQLSGKTYMIYESNKDVSEKNIEIFIDTRSTLQEISCFFGEVLEDILKVTKEDKNFKSLSSEQKDEEVKGLIEIYQTIFNSLSQRIIDLSDNKKDINLEDLNRLNKNEV